MSEKRVDTDILIIGGGTAGSMAAIKAKEAMPHGRILLLEKANVKRSGAIALGMDGVNNAVLPGHATPRRYVKEIAMANDGIIRRRPSSPMPGKPCHGAGAGILGREIPEEADAGEYDVEKVHFKGGSVLPMPEGSTSRKFDADPPQHPVEVANHVMATHVLMEDGKGRGSHGVRHPHRGDSPSSAPRPLILACVASGRLDLPATGCLIGTSG